MQFIPQPAQTYLALSAKLSEDNLGTWRLDRDKSILRKLTRLNSHEALLYAKRVSPAAFAAATGAGAATSATYVVWSFQIALCSDELLSILLASHGPNSAWTLVSQDTYEFPSPTALPSFTWYLVERARVAGGSGVGRTACARFAHNPPPQRPPQSCHDRMSSALSGPLEHVPVTARP